MASKQKAEIGVSSIVKRDKSQSFTQIDDEIVMLSYNQGEYFALNETASKIWTLIESPIAVSDLIKLLMNEYNVPYGDCLSDTNNCLTDLYKKKLVEIL